MAPGGLWEGGKNGENGEKNPALLFSVLWEGLEKLHGPS